MSWEVVYSKQALKDAKKVKAVAAQAHLLHLLHRLNKTPDSTLQCAITLAYADRAEGLASVAAALGAARLLRSEVVSQRRARILGKASGVTLVGLGIYVAVSKRGA